jgi:hypothetical protein
MLKSLLIIQMINSVQAKMKIVKLTVDTHSKLMQFKAVNKLKTASDAVDKALKEAEWSA